MESSLRERKNYLILSVIVFIISLLILQPFLLGMLWGLVAALAMWPVFEKLTCNPAGVSIGAFRLRFSPSAAAFALAVAFVLIVVVPLCYAGFEVANAYNAGSAYLARGSQHGLIAPPAFLAYLPLRDKMEAFWNNKIALSVDIVDALNRITDGKLLPVLSALWGQLLSRAIAVVVMIITFYLLLKNGRAFKDGGPAVLSHWVGPRSVVYLENGIIALRGTINGVVLVGVLEGVLLSIPLIAGGMGSGVLVGLAAGILGVIPLLMPLLIAPCLAYMYLVGQTGWAIVGGIDLLLVWLIFENAIKPDMISHTVKINAFIILISMIGGMHLVGLVGLFLGPAIVSMAMGMFRDLVMLPVDRH